MACLSLSQQATRDALNICTRFEGEDDSGYKNSDMMKAIQNSKQKQVTMMDYSEKKMSRDVIDEEMDEQEARH
jgi:hypothetical protein